MLITTVITERLENTVSRMFFNALGNIIYIFNDPYIA